MAVTPDYVPRRWKSPHRSSRWLAARPERLLVLWGSLSVLAVAAVIGTIAGLPIYLGVPLVFAALLNLAPDVRYVPRAISAWRAGRRRSSQTGSA